MVTPHHESNLDVLGHSYLNLTKNGEEFTHDALSKKSELREEFRCAMIAFSDDKSTGRIEYAAFGRAVGLYDQDTPAFELSLKVLLATMVAGSDGISSVNGRQTDPKVGMLAHFQTIDFLQFFYTTVIASSYDENIEPENSKFNQGKFEKTVKKIAELQPILVGAAKSYQKGLYSRFKGVFGLTKEQTDKITNIISENGVDLVELRKQSAV